MPGLVRILKPKNSKTLLPLSFSLFSLLLLPPSLFLLHSPSSLFSTSDKDPAGHLEILKPRDLMTFEAQPNVCKDVDVIDDDVWSPGMTRGLWYEAYDTRLLYLWRWLGMWNFWCPEKSELAYLSVCFHETRGLWPEAYDPRLMKRGFWHQANDTRIWRYFAFLALLKLTFGFLPLAKMCFLV